MKISKGVTYHAFDDKVFVHTATHKNLILDENALEIFDYVAKNPSCTVAEMCDFFAAQYEDDDAEEIRIGISEFVEEMLAENLFCETDDSAPLLHTVFEDVSNYFKKSNKLFSMTLELTYRCVEKCVHCYIDDAKPFCAKDELTLDDYKNFLRQAREMGCVKVLLTGGEVLLRKDFCDIAEFAVAQGFIVDIYTTGLGLTDEIFDRLCALNLNSVSFSLYGGDAASHDAITGIRGSFDKTLKAMLMFRSAGIETFIKCVAIKQNIDALESLYQLANRLNIFISVSTRIQSGHECKRAEDYRLGKADLYEKVFALDKKYRHLKIETIAQENLDKIRDKQICAAGLSSLLVDPSGGVHFCGGFHESLGNVREENLQSIWENVNAAARKRIPKICNLTPACKTCKYIEFCHVCVAELEREDKTFSTCGHVLVEAKAATKAYLQQG